MCMQALKEIDFKDQTPEWVKQLLAAPLPDPPAKREQATTSAREEAEPEAKAVRAYAMTLFRSDLEGLVDQGWDLEC